MRQKRKNVSKMNKMLKMIRECEGVLMAAYSLQCLNVWHHECLTVAKLVGFLFLIIQQCCKTKKNSLKFSIVSN